MMRPAVALLFLYLGLVPLAKITLPVAGVGIPLPELLFLLLLGITLAGAELRRDLLRLRIDALDGAVVGLVAAVAVAWWVNYPRGSGRELPVLAYLALLFRLTRTIVRRHPMPEGFVYRAALVLGAVLVLSGIGSWLLAIYRPELRLLVLEPKYFPGWGTWPRLEGLTMSPNLFANLCQLPLLILFAAGWKIFRYRKWQVAGGALLLLTVLATGSKSLPLLAAGLLILAVRSEPWRYLGWTLAGALTLFFLAAPKVIPIRDGQADRAVISRQSYFGGDTLGRVGPYTLYASTHLRLNYLALHAFRQHPVCGYGPGTFPDYLAAQRAQGRYPDRLPRYDPHQLYLGTLAEYGLLGGVALAFFLWQLGKKVVGRKNRWVTGAGLGLVAYLVLWALEGWHMDTLHFRQFWWVAGVIAGLSDAARVAEEASLERHAAPSP